MRLRNSTYRSNYERWARDMDETRVIVSYNFAALNGCFASLLAPDNGC